TGQGATRPTDPASPRCMCGVTTRNHLVATTRGSPANLRGAGLFLALDDLGRAKIAVVDDHARHSPGITLPEIQFLTLHVTAILVRIHVGGTPVSASAARDRNRKRRLEQDAEVP